MSFDEEKCGVVSRAEGRDFSVDGGDDEGWVGMNRPRTSGRLSNEEGKERGVRGDGLRELCGIYGVDAAERANKEANEPTRARAAREEANEVGKEGVEEIHGQIVAKPVEAIGRICLCGDF